MAKKRGQNKAKPKMIEPDFWRGRGMYSKRAIAAAANECTRALEGK